MQVCLGYIDPGAGSLLLQMIAAGVIGSLVYFRRAVGRLAKRLFRKKPQDEASSDDADRSQS